jgi:mRNA interferase MazF
LTTTTTDVPLLRIPLQPNRANGLTTLCSVMLDKITTVRRSRLGHCIGRVSTTEMLQVERGILVFFGMTG